MKLQEKLRILEERSEMIREIARKWGLKDINNLFADLVEYNIGEARRKGNSSYYARARNFLKKEINHIKEYKTWEREYNLLRFRRN